MKITITKIETKPAPNNGTRTGIQSEKGVWYSGFLDELKTLKEGDVIEAEIKTKGQYNNIISFKLATGNQPTPNPPGTLIFNRDGAIEHNIWIKELGEAVRASTPSCPQDMRNWYWARMRDETLEYKG